MIEKQAGEVASSYATYGGSGSAIIFGMSANEFAALGGFAIALIGLCCNVFFQYKRHKVMTEQQHINELARQGLIERRKQNDVTS